MPEDFKVTPWEVTGDIDYDLLQERFGTTPIDEAMKERLSKYGDIHPMIRRGIFYSHRDLIPLLDHYDKGNPFVLYTGRGPSGNTHLGHLMPWIFNKWVQDTFGVDMLFQMTDDEKFLFKDMTLGDTTSMAYQNALDFIALGFDPKKTRIILNTKNIDTLYPIALRISKKVTFSTAKAVFGFDNSTNIGSIFYTTLQSVPAFLPTEEAGKQVPVLRYTHTVLRQERSPVMSHPDSITPSPLLCTARCSPDSPAATRCHHPMRTRPYTPRTRPRPSRRRWAVPSPAVAFPSRSRGRREETPRSVPYSSTIITSSKRMMRN